MQFLILLHLQVKQDFALQEGSSFFFFITTTINLYKCVEHLVHIIDLAAAVIM